MSKETIEVEFSKKEMNSIRQFMEEQNCADLDETINLIVREYYKKHFRGKK